MVLVTVVLLITAMLVASAAAGLARPVICSYPCVFGGTSLPTMVCDVVADDS